MPSTQWLTLMCNSFPSSDDVKLSLRKRLICQLMFLESRIDTYTLSVYAFQMRKRATTLHDKPPYIYGTDSRDCAQRRKNCSSRFRLHIISGRQLEIL